MLSTYRHFVIPFGKCASAFSSALSKLTACVPASKFGHFTYQTLIVVFKSGLHARHSLADCVYHLQV